MQAIILAGGRGRRLTPFTEQCPKPLVPLGDRPILDTILRQLKHFGFTQVTLAVGHMADQIQHYVGSGARYGLDVSYTFEAEPLGTAGPLALVEPLEQQFLVMNGDLITSLNYRDLLTFHRKQGALATIGTCPKMFQIDLGIIQANERAQITDYIEKPCYTFQVTMRQAAVSGWGAGGQLSLRWLLDGHWQSRRLRKGPRRLSRRQGEVTS